MIPNWIWCYVTENRWAYHCEMIKKCALFTAHLRSWSLKSLRMRIHWVAWNDVIELVLLNFERRQYLDLWRQDKKKFARNSHAVTINGAKNVHCTECKRRCLSKNTCYLSIILVNNHNQWAWNLNCCSYLNMCVCVVYVPLEFHALIDEVSKNGMRSVLYLTKIYCETHSTSQSPPLKHPIC